MRTAIGGAETMSLAPYLLPANRFGSRPGDVVVTDSLMGGLTDPMTDAEGHVTTYGCTLIASGTGLKVS